MLTDAGCGAAKLDLRMVWYSSVSLVSVVRVITFGGGRPGGMPLEVGTRKPLGVDVGGLSLLICKFCSVVEGILVRDQGGVSCCGY